MRPLQSKWEVGHYINKKTKPLADVIHELQGKVVKAAQQLHQQLIDSAEQPASTTFVQNTANISNVSESALLSPDGAEEPQPAFDQILANLKERQRKRLESASAEENRPAAKSKLDRRGSKRTQCGASVSDEAIAPKSKERRLIAEDFVVAAARVADPENSSSSSSQLPQEPLLRLQSEMQPFEKERQRLKKKCKKSILQADLDEL